MLNPTYDCSRFFLTVTRARTFNGVRSVRDRPAGPAAKAPRALPSKTSELAVPLSHRFRPGTRARMEIRNWRNRQPEKLLISHLPFERVLCEIVQDFIEAPRFQAAAIESLHYPAESHLTKLFEDVNLLGRHAKRISIYKTDSMLVRRIRGEI